MSTQALQKSHQAKMQLEEALLRGTGARGEMMKRVGGSVSVCAWNCLSVKFKSAFSARFQSFGHEPPPKLSYFINVWSASHCKNQFQVTQSMLRDSQSPYEVCLFCFKQCLKHGYTLVYLETK